MDLLGITLKCNTVYKIRKKMVKIFKKFETELYQSVVKFIKVFQF